MLKKIRSSKHYTFVAKGSFGKVVWEADCSTTGATKTIKMRRGLASAEVKLLQRCKHPNVIALEDQIRVHSLQKGGHTGLVFPVYDMDVRQFINRRRGVDPEEYPEQHKVQIASGLWHGLKYLHSLSIVHRDIKPANILINFFLGDN